MADDSGNDADEDQWRFSLEDLESDDDEDSGGNITGAFSPGEDLEPGEVDFENALFVLLGVAGMLLIVAGFVLL